MKTETAAPANASNMFTLDEEKVEKKATAATVRIVRSDEAERLQWNETKLGWRILNHDTMNTDMKMMHEPWISDLWVVYYSVRYVTSYHNNAKAQVCKCDGET